eukprot:543531_1
MDELDRISTENVNLHSAVRTICQHTDDIVSKYSQIQIKYNKNIDKIENLCIFMTGFTGDVGGYVARSLLKRNNTIYCIVRPSINPILSQFNRHQYHHQSYQQDHQHYFQH